MSKRDELVEIIDKHSKEIEGALGDRFITFGGTFDLTDAILAWCEKEKIQAAIEQTHFIKAEHDHRLEEVRRVWETINSHTSKTIYCEYSEEMYQSISNLAKSCGWEKEGK